jgi:ABC-type uncharacterized transport system substrate-binding protein
VTASPLTLVHRDLVIKLAARHKLPAVYWDRIFLASGGLISYGPDYGHDVVNQFQRATGYVDRVLKGEKHGDLPVQAPTEYEIVINLKAAEALGLAVIVRTCACQRGDRISLAMSAICPKRTRRPPIVAAAFGVKADTTVRLRRGS